MFLKTGILILLFLGEIALGIYSFLFTTSLVARFSFFVLTCFLVTMLVIKFAGPGISETEEPIMEEKETVLQNR